MVAVFIPGLKFTPRAKLPDHQSQAALPGFIQEVSERADGALRLSTRSFDSMRSPGIRLTSRTRQGVALGVVPTTAWSERFGSGESLLARALGTPRTPPAYIPA